VSARIAHRDALPAARASTATERTASWLLGCGSALAIAGVAYSIRRFHEQPWRGLPWHVALGACAALLAWCAIGLEPSRRVRCAMLAVGVAVTLVGADVLIGMKPRLRLLRINRELGTITGRPVELRPIPEIVRELRRSGAPAVPSVVPSIILPFVGTAGPPSTAWTAPLLPLAGIALRPTVMLCNEAGHSPTYMSDEHGFANPAGSWSMPQVDVLLLGDSFTHGFCVDPDSTFAAFLRREQAGVLNLGIDGDGPLTELATLVEYAALKRPRVLVWQVADDDLADLAVELQNPILSRYLEPGFSQRLSVRQPQVDSAAIPWVEALYARGQGVDAAGEFSWRSVMTLYNLRHTVSVTLSPSRQPEPRPSVESLRQVLRRAQEEVASWNGRMLLMLAPDWHQSFDPRSTGLYAARPGIRTLAADLGIPVLDLDERFRTDPAREQLFARRNLATSHPSPAGQRLMAQELARAVLLLSTNGTGGALRADSTRRQVSAQSSPP
jgi:hypothetical protein